MTCVQHTRNKELSDCILLSTVGLDPAGPAFDSRPLPAGLNPTCADLVDVIHTNGPRFLVFGLGSLRPVGHIDFYPNGGSKNPGCTVDLFGGFINLGGLFTKVNDSLHTGNRSQ